MGRQGENSLGEAGAGVEDEDAGHVGAEAGQRLLYLLVGQAAGQEQLVLHHPPLIAARQLAEGVAEAVVAKLVLHQHGHVVPVVDGQQADQASGHVRVGRLQAQVERVVHLPRTERQGKNVIVFFSGVGVVIQLAGMDYIKRSVLYAMR